MAATPSGLYKILSWQFPNITQTGHQRSLDTQRNSQCWKNTDHSNCV